MHCSVSVLPYMRLYRQMHGDTGIATDITRHVRAGGMARRIARSCRRLFVAKTTA